VSRLPGFITRNFKLKIGCAVLAVITWTGVVYAGNPPQTRPFQIPVPQTGVPSGFTLIHTVQPLSIRVGGTKDALDSFDVSSDVTVKVNWKVVKDGGVQSVPISVDNNDSAVELLDAPTSVQVNLDTVTSVTAPVTIKINSLPPAGINVGTPSASPTTVTVVGPTHELKDIEVRASVDLKDQRSNFQQDTQLYAFDGKGNPLSTDVELQPSVARVTIQLQSVITSRVVAVEPSIVGRVGPGFALSSVRYSPESITISGPQDLLNNIDAVSTSNISINGLSGNVNLTVQLLLPDGVTASVGTISVNLVVTQITPATPAPTPTPIPSPGPT